MLLAYPRKLFESALQKEVTGPGFHPMQGGFQAKKSTLDQVAVFDHACHIAKREGKPMYIAFLDIWAAYDTVDRNLLWGRMRERGSCERTTRLLARMGRNTRFNVISNGNYSKTLKARGGVQQGGTLSPSEYNILIDTLCDKLEEALNAPNATGTIKTADGGTLGGLLFADDVALFTTNPYTLQSLISICEEHSRTWGYRWKPGKSKIVQKPGPTFSQFTIYGEAMGSTPMFTYLGCPFDAYGINAPALIHKNIGAMSAAAHEMTLLGVNGSGFSTYRSVLAWKSFVRPCLEYGLALVTLTKKLRKSLEKAHTMGLRMAIGGYKRSSIEAMRQLCKAEPMEVRCQESQLRWICHALQAPTTSLVRKILPDALNDQSSPLRKLADSSEMWRHLPGRDLPMGPALPSLWTESERAAIAFRLAEHRRPQWNFQQSDEAEAGGDSFTNAQSLVVTKEYLIGKENN